MGELQDSIQTVFREKGYTLTETENRAIKQAVKEVSGLYLGDAITFIFALNVGMARAYIIMSQYKTDEISGRADGLTTIPTGQLLPLLTRNELRYNGEPINGTFPEGQLLEVAADKISARTVRVNFETGESMKGDVLTVRDIVVMLGVGGLAMRAAQEGKKLIFSIDELLRAVTGKAKGERAHFSDDMRAALHGSMAKLRVNEIVYNARGLKDSEGMPIRYSREPIIDSRFLYLQNGESAYEIRAIPVFRLALARNNRLITIDNSELRRIKGRGQTYDRQMIAENVIKWTELQRANIKRDARKRKTERRPMFRDIMRLNTLLYDSGIDVSTLSRIQKKRLADYVGAVLDARREVGKIKTWEKVTEKYGRGHSLIGFRLNY